MTTSLRSALFLWLMLFAANARTALEEVREDEWKAIRDVISAQLEAFKRDDAPRAFFFAAPSIRRQFRTPVDFLKMVRADYAAVYRPRSVRFLEHFVLAGQAVQRLEIVTRDDEVLVAYYIMEQQPDGTWKIAVCALKTTPPAMV